jgi:hypothetical protein
MKLLRIKVGGILALALYATACSQPNNQPVNSVATKSATTNATPTPAIREPDIEDLPKGWTREEILERGDLTKLTGRDPCIASKKGSTKSHVINVSVYVDMRGLNGIVMAAHALPDEQADPEELKEAETEVKKSLIFVGVDRPGAYIRTPQKWHGNIEVKVRFVCV